MRNGKYQRQLKRVFIMIGFLFTLSFMIGLGVVITSSVKHQYQNTVKNNVSSNNMLAEVTISTIMSAGNALMQDADIDAWGKSTTRSDFYFDATKACSKIQQAAFQFSMVPFYPAVTRMEPDVFVISSLGTSSKDLYFETETTLDAAQIQYIFDYFAVNPGELLIPTYKDGALNELYYIRRKVYDRGDLLFLVKIPRSSLFGSNLDQKFLLFNPDGILAYSHQDDDVKNNLKQVYHDIITENSTPSLVKSQGKQIYISSFSKNNWNIAYVYPDLGLNLIQITCYIILPFILLSVLAFIFSRTISSWLYSPMKEVICEVTEQEKEGQTSSTVFDEFSLLKQNAATAKSLAAELQAVMNDNDSLVSQKFYRDLMFGVNTQKNDLYRDFPLKQEPYCVALFEFQNPDREYLENDIFFCKNTIFSIVHENPLLQSVNVNYAACAIIIQTGSLDFGKNLVLEISQALPENQSIKIAVSDIRTGMIQIHDCFLEASKILEYKYLYSTSELLTAQQVFSSESSSYYYPLAVENRLVQRLAEGKDATLSQFDDLIRENFMHRSLSPDTLRSFIYTLLCTLSRVCQELKAAPEELLGYDPHIEKLYADWGHPNIISQIRKIIEDILYAVKNRNASADNKMLTEMRTFIYNRYSSDIMLDDMAEELGISGKYCSNLFKKLCDDTFKNFLNKYRVEKAKEMIDADPNIKISDLSVKVGFNSSNTFIRVFGKYSGMTPKAYSNMVHQSKN